MMMVSRDVLQWWCRTNPLRRTMTNPSTRILPDLTDSTVEDEQYQRLLHGKLPYDEKSALLAKLDRDARALALTDPDKVGESIMDFSTIQHGLLNAGTVTPFGVIEQTSLTAYLVDGTWVPFSKVHGPYQAATPLVTFDTDDTNDGPDRRGDR